ncbi:MAG TPA: hypothetical protein ENJ31_03735 [Anaerolineae bacterium]|nr:hypothetical protein [Anaerolineae bacterium]
MRIAEGTYTGVSTEDGKTALVHLRQRDINLTLRGGYTTSDWNQANPAAHPVVLDAQGQGVVIYVACNGCSRRLTFDGLHITGGYASTAATGVESGAGIHIEDMPHVTVQNCEVYSNTAENDKAGGIRYQDSDDGVIQNNVVRDNTGQGISLASSRSPDLLDNTVTGNIATGISLSSCHGRVTVQGNTVRQNGRGVWIDSALNGTVENNTILSNTVGSSQPGGGLMVRWSTLTIRDNVIRGNVSDRGGGLYLEGSSDTLIENNHIEGNGATVSWDSEGGGMYLDIGETTTIRGNTVLSNTARGEGGGAYVHGPHPADVLVENNTFIGNSGSLGGGLSINTGAVQGNTFRDNTASQGGGLYTNPWEGLWLKRNLFSGNQVGEEGGGIYVYLGYPVYLEANLILGNQAGGSGGGLYSFYQVPSLDGHISLTNTLLAENQAAHGSGLYLYGGAATLKHTTLANNGGGSADGIGLYVKPFGVVSVTLTNTIVASQTVGVYAEGGDVSLTATLWGAGGWDNGADRGGGGNVVTGTLNYWDAPLFVDPAGGDYHISAASPARDKGIDAGVRDDMDGELRPHPDTGIPDLGADEYHLDDIRIYLPLVVRNR